MAVDGFDDIADEARGITDAILMEQLTDRAYRVELVHRWPCELLRKIIKQLGQPRFQDFILVISCLIASAQPNAFYAVAHSL
jgi:hypothetical protein